MKTAINLLAGLVLSSLALGAHADSFDGHIDFHNDVSYYSIQITQPGSSMLLWTDSYINGANFDPILNVYYKKNRIAENDDFPGIDPANQTRYDSGLRLTNLAIGNYVVAVTAYGNFSAGATVGSGFVYDGQAPIGLDAWCQPASHCDMAKHFSLHWKIN
ncbi:MAG TPA: DVUA0089 family protein [Telluria sp.]|nr:DVUA0089 family protein [Telluria sp.]